MGFRIGGANAIEAFKEIRAACGLPDTATVEDCVRWIEAAKDVCRKVIAATAALHGAEVIAELERAGKR
jgi:hypothetical protein